MAAKKDSSMLMLLLLAAGGYWYWNEQKKKTGTQTPGTLSNNFPGTQPVNSSVSSTGGATTTGSASFINYAGQPVKNDIAINEFKTLIDDGYVNADSLKLGLTPYEMDTLYFYYHAETFVPDAEMDHLNAETDKIYDKYPGLKV